MHTFILPVPGFPGYYASINGNVYSTMRGRRDRAMGTPDRYGYLCTALKKEGKEYRYRIHTLIALTFLGPRPEGKEVDHKNANKLDNRPANLQYLTRSEHVKKGYANGEYENCREKWKERTRQTRKLTYAQALEIRALYATGNYTHQELGNRYGVAHNVIGSITRNRNYVNP